MQTAEFIGELGGKRNVAPFQNQKSGAGGVVCAVGALRNEPWGSLSSAGVCSDGTEFPKVAVFWHFPKCWDGVSQLNPLC